MRAPNHLQIKEFCRLSLDKLMTKAGLESVKNIIIDENGWVNVTAFVNNSYVVRFNARDTDLPKFQREKIMYEALKNLVPVPQLLVFDDSKTVVPFDYMICNKIEGENLEQSWSSIDEKNSYRLAYQAGQILSKIHSVSIQNYGELSGLGPFPKSKSWEEYLRFVLNYHLREATELSLFTFEEQQKFIKLFESTAEILNSLKNSKLLHGDFHFGNLLFKNDKITGVLDFEWSLAGDPLWDISNNLRDMDSKWPSSQQAFNEGYGIDSFSDEEISRMKVYTMIKSIELCVVAKKFFSEDESKEYVQLTKKNYCVLQ